MLRQQLINGLALGGLYALTAIGYSLVYGVMELVNFAHGAVYMVGAYLFYIAFALWGLPLPLSLPLAIAATGGAGVLVEQVALTPFKRAKLPMVYSLIATIGLSIVMQNVMLLIMGSETRRYPAFFDGMLVEIAGARVSVLTLFTIALCAALILALSLFLKLSKTGRAMRATAQDSYAADLCGVKSERIVRLCFFLGGSLAAIAGILGSASWLSVDIGIGVAIGMKAFAATVLGGIGSIGGAALGGLVIGVVETLVAGYIGASLRDMAAFIILIVILIIRPNGLLARKVQRKV